MGNDMSISKTNSGRISDNESKGYQANGGINA